MTFIPGFELSRSFFVDAVRPILTSDFPVLEYAAALIGSGSEVLGYDSERSTDHHWGPRVMLFVSPDDLALAPTISELLGGRLPPMFRGYSTNFGSPDEIGVRLPEPAVRGAPIAHRVEIHEVRSYFTAVLGFDPLNDISVEDWLMTPSQSLLEATVGAVFHDGVGQLTDARTRLAWYPHDIWLYIMACQWRRIAEEEAFVGRCAEVGDEIGSRIVAARIVRDLMRLCCLLERCYAPYTKWLGTAFGTLECMPSLAPSLMLALDATEYAAREQALCNAYEIVGRMHNALGVAESVDPSSRLYYDRPFRVLRADRFADALRAVITDQRVRKLSLIGAIDQFVDSTAALGAMKLRAALKRVL